MDQDDPITDTTHDRVMKDLKPVLEKVRQTLRQVYSTAGREADWLTPEETSHNASRGPVGRRVVPKVDNWVQ